MTEPKDTSNKFPYFFPPGKTLFTAMLALILLYSIQFLWHIGDDFFQTNYNWNKKKILKEITPVTIDTFSYNFLQIQTNNKYNPNNQHSYEVIDQANKYYFRYEFSIKDQGNIRFYGLEWLAGQPDHLAPDSKLNEVDIPLIQKNKMTAISLGDEWVCTNDSKYFRRHIAHQIPLNFIGTRRDVFNYPFEGSPDTSTNDIISKLKNIPATDNLILYFDGNPAVESKDEILKNIEKIYKILLQKKWKHIYWINLPNTDNQKISELNSQINESIKQRGSDKIEIVNVSDILQPIANYQLQDHWHLNKAGYEKLGDYIAHQIKIND